MSTPRPWKLILTKKWPFGFSIEDGDGQTIITEHAICYSSSQKTRADNENGVGFPANNKQGQNFTTRDQAIVAVREQIEQARLIVTAVNAHDALIEALRDAERVINACIPVEATVPVPGISRKIRAALRAAGVEQ